MFRKLYSHTTHVTITKMVINSFSKYLCNNFNVIN